MNIASGTEVSHYRILQPIGRGGMGEVYLALDLSLNRRVAIKFVEARPDLDRQPLRPPPEAHLAAALDHPAIVKVYEVGRHRDRSFIVMEYVEGTSLADLLQKDLRLPPARVVDIALQLCSALAATHERGIVHGDIKPANIKIDGLGRVRILDFGVARALGRTEDSLRSELAGTISYMAPELLHGGAEGASSDLFAVGVLLYRMLAGRLPFDGTYDAEVVYAITNKPPAPLQNVAPGVPAELAAIVDRLLEKDPKNRYAAAADLLPLLNALSVRSPSPERRTMRTLLLLAGGLLLFVLAVAVWPFRSHQSDRLRPPGQLPMIAVLPFDNLGAPGDDYFSDGMTDAVTMALAQRGSCRVISRQSSMLYKKTTMTLPQVALELGADFLVTGSIHWKRTESDSVRITLALVEPATDAYVWTHDYADRLERIFTVQADMARDIGQAIAPGGAPGRPPTPPEQPTTSLKAYDYFLRGNEYFFRSWDKSDIEMARRLYLQANSADSNFALALAMLARCDASLFWERYDPSEQRRDRAFEEARKALAHTPDLAEARLALGYCYYHGERDYERALAQFETGLARNPNHSDLWNAVAAVHRRQGKIEQSLAEFERSLELDPRSHLKAFDVGLTLGMLRRFKEAESYLERTTLLAPDYALAWLYRSWLPILDGGDTAKARTILNRAAEVTDLARSKYYWILCRILPPSDEILGGPRSPGCDMVSYYLYRARRARQTADPSRGHAYSDSARAILEGTVRMFPSDAYAQSELGIALAGLDDRAPALEHGQKALELLPDSREAFDAPFLLLNMAEICVMVGALDDATGLLEQLLRIPGFASRQYLKLDFVWTPLYHHPRFRQLVEPSQASSVAESP